MDELLANGRSDAENVIIFMTDGEANEPFGDNAQNCSYAQQRADAAKSAGIIMVTIAYRLQNVNCGPTPATTRLANMASSSPGGPSLDDSGGQGNGGCNNQTEVDGENSDGDFFFCTPNPDDLSPILQAPVQVASEGIRLIQLPG